MASDDIKWDDSDFQVKTNQKLEQAIKNSIKATNAVAHVLLLASQEEVPIHTVEGEPGGDLARSGVVIPATGIGEIKATVGYNKAYAAYQHEGVRKDGTHVVRNYTNPRSKKKFLEDPLKRNLSIFQQYFRSILG